VVAAVAVAVAVAVTVVAEPAAETGVAPDEVWVQGQARGTVPDSVPVPVRARRRPVD
jgi:hypothetical protein